MEKVHLRRTGLPPLAFTGEVVAKENSRIDGSGHLEGRWHEATLYRAQDGRYVLYVEYKTRWNELPNEVAFVAQTPAEVSKTLLDYNAVQWMTGFPPGPKYAALKDEACAMVRSGWESLVSRLLDRPEFAEPL